MNRLVFLVLSINHEKYSFHTLFHRNIRFLCISNQKQRILKLKRDIDLVWLDLNCSYAHASLALPALHAQVMNDTRFDTVKWHVVSATTATPFRDIVNPILSFTPDIIATTFWLFNHEFLLHILSRVRTLLPEATIIGGGPEFLGDNEQFLRNNRFIDVVVRGEGETIFPQWLLCADDKLAWKEIAGLCFLDSYSHYQDNVIARAEPFDELVAPEESPFFNWSKPFVQLETTRGCFNTCAFCVSGGEKPVRVLSTDVIEQRIETIHAQGIRNIRLLDRTFNYNSQRAIELLRIFKRFSPDICFHLEIHPALISDEIKMLLTQLPHDLLHIEAGIQSLREPVLKQSRRAGRLTEALSGLQFLCSLPNMETHADLIAGLPLYSYADLLEDIHTLALYNVGEIQLELLKLLPGTAMRRDAESLGIRYSPLPPYEVLETSHISASELQQTHYLSRILDGYYNAEAWHTCMQRMLCENSDFLPRFTAYMVIKNRIDQPLSLEKRGVSLFEFCRDQYPHYCEWISIAWISCGLSLRREAAEQVIQRPIPADALLQIEKGTSGKNLKSYYLPLAAGGGYWFGFEVETQNRVPVFIARQD